MVKGIVGVKVIVKIMSVAGGVYWRSGEGETLREALVRVVTVGKNGGGRMKSKCKEVIKGQLCWAELDLRERDSEKAVAAVVVKSDGAMDAEFLGEGESKSGPVDKSKLVIKARGKKRGIGNA